LDRDGAPPSAAHHARQALAETMGWPAWQEKAFWNSGIFRSTPFTRALAGEWGFVYTCRRSASGLWFSHQIWLADLVQPAFEFVTGRDFSPS